MKINVTEIDWDTDGETVDLPTEVTIDTQAEGMEDPDAEIADWLSDKYGWCVSRFSQEIVPEAGPSMN